MQRRLTITISNEIHQGLHDKIGRRGISQFIEGLVRRHLDLDKDDLEEEYRQAALDEEAEREAREWVEADLEGR